MESAGATSTRVKRPDSTVEGPVPKRRRTSNEQAYVSDETNERVSSSEEADRSGQKHQDRTTSEEQETEIKREYALDEGNAKEELETQRPGTGQRDTETVPIEGSMLGKEIDGDGNDNVSMRAENHETGMEIDEGVQDIALGNSASWSDTNEEVKDGRNEKAGRILRMGGVTGNKKTPTSWMNWF